MTELTFASKRIYTGSERPFEGYVRMSGPVIVEVVRGKLPKSDHKAGGRNLTADATAIPQSAAGLEKAVGPAGVVDLGNARLIPGLIDLHVHGSAGVDVGASDVDGLAKLADYFAQDGVTSFQPTMSTLPVADLERAIECVRDFTLGQTVGGRHSVLGQKGDAGHPVLERAGGTDGSIVAQGCGARSLGLHMEGPFLNPLRKGSMPGELMKAPDIPLMERWLELGKGTIRHVTVAPEIPGASDLIRFLAGREVTVSAGHTDATYDEMMCGFELGITVVNHTFNAMREFHHREPGALGAALTHPAAYCELIADRIHVHPAAMRLLVLSKGQDRVCLVTDAIAAAGLPPGEYPSLGRTVIVDESGTCRLPDGTLAGSTAKLRLCLKNMVETVGFEFGLALRMATINPAKAARVFDRKGSIAVGKDADLVVLDDDYEVLWSVVEGTVCRADERFSKQA